MEFLKVVPRYPRDTPRNPKDIRKNPKDTPMIEITTYTLGVSLDSKGHPWITKKPQGYPKIPKGYL